MVISLIPHKENILYEPVCFWLNKNYSKNIFNYTRFLWILIVKNFLKMPVLLPTVSAAKNQSVSLKKKLEFVSYVIV